jgi:hypothetical protein
MRLSQNKQTNKNYVIIMDIKTFPTKIVKNTEITFIFNSKSAFKVGLPLEILYYLGIILYTATLFLSSKPIVHDFGSAVCSLYWKCLLSTWFT